MAKKPINSRAKGAAGELELAHKLTELGYPSRRGQQFSGNNGDADVVGDLEGIHIECKRVEALNLDTAYEQAVNDAREGLIPAVFHRKNRKPWKVTLSLEDFIKLYGAYFGKEKTNVKTRCTLFQDNGSGKGQNN